MCIPPDSDRFGQMLIDYKITKLCTEQALEYRRLEQAHPTSRPTSALPSPRTPGTPAVSRPLQTLRFKAINDAHDTTSSGYSTETIDNDRYTLSPTSPVPFRHPWSGANAPRSMPRPLDEELLSPKSLMATVKAKRAAEHAFVAPPASSMTMPASSPQVRRFNDRMELDEDYYGDNSEMDVEGRLGRYKNAGGAKQGAQSPMKRYHADSVEPEEHEEGFDEKDVAKALMSLWGVKKVKKRRASA